MKALIIAQDPAKGFEDATPVVGTNDKGEMCATGKVWNSWLEALPFVCGPDQILYPRSWLPIIQNIFLEYKNLWNSEGHLQCPIDILREDIKRYDLVITLGRRAFDYISRNTNTKRHIALPHPSGRNRKLNDKEYVYDMLTEFRNAFLHHYACIYAERKYVFDCHPLFFRSEGEES